MIGAHIRTDNFLYFDQTAANIAIEQQKLIPISLPNLPNLFHHVYLDLRQFSSECRVLIPHLLPHPLHMPDLLILLLHQQLVKLLVKITDAIDHLWEFLLGSGEVVMAVVD